LIYFVASVVILLNTNI